ncbi:MAG: ABC transporter substrate-binding protein [Acidimicrobiales bacterium]
MIPRGSFLRSLGAGVVLASSVFGAFAASAATPSSVVNTLNLSLPGPFNGCTILDPGATPTTNAILDLLRPSAFLTTPAGNLVGEGGAITSAELVSLSPETVVYTIAPDQHWSDGATFSGADLVAWWQRARQLASVQSDGYRDIRSLVESSDGLTVTATFATPFAEWNELFRDVEAPGTPAGCTWSDFLARPSLGPYEVVSASANRLLLVANAKWPLDPNRFARVVITDSSTIPSSPNAYFASYSLNVTSATVEAASAHPSISSHIGTSSDNAEITFAPQRPLTRSLSIREALSLILIRQRIINDIYGSVTFSPSVAQSALYSQGQSAYPGGNGSGPSAQSTTTTITSTSSSGSLADCTVCALDLLKKAGYVRTPTGWHDATGALLTVRATLGPTPLDRQVADQVESQWRADGIAVTSEVASSDQLAAYAAASNQSDVAIFTRPTTTTASYTARSFAGPAYLDSYPSGVRTSALNALYAKGISIFNPVTAQSTWLDLDQAVMSDFWVRPLFTAPSLVEWSNTIGLVYGSISVPGLADQVTGWGIVQPTSRG